MTRLLGAFLALTLILGVIAWAAPPGREDSDRHVYEQTASQIIIPNCDQLHCFRVLVPWLLGRVPGPSLWIWKSYAVICTSAAAIAVFLLCTAWAVPRRAGQYAAAASAFGFGSMYVLYDPFTSDPLMFLAGPLTLWLFAIDRPALSAGLAAVFIAAKEFAVVPVYIQSAVDWLEGRRRPAARVAAIASGVLAVWIGLQLWLRNAHDYSFGVNPSVQPLNGGYLWHWFKTLPVEVAIFAMVAQFGVLWILAPAGWRLAPARLRHASLASLLPAAVLIYFQQPDRALWNFHFLVTPLAGLVLARVPTLLAVATLAAFALANLRVGAQLAFVPASSVSLALSLLLGAVCCGWVWRRLEKLSV